MAVLRVVVPGIPDSEVWMLPGFISMVTSTASVMTLEKEDDMARQLFEDPTSRDRPAETGHA
jgi:hypothetical protein